MPASSAASGWVEHAGLGGGDEEEKEGEARVVPRRDEGRESLELRGLGCR